MPPNLCFQQLLAQFFNLSIFVIQKFRREGTSIGQLSDASLMKEDKNAMSVEQTLMGMGVGDGGGSRRDRLRGGETDRERAEKEKEREYREK